MESVMCTTESNKQRNVELPIIKKSNSKSRKYGQINVVTSPKNKVDCSVTKESSMTNIKKVQDTPLEKDEAYQSSEEGQKEQPELNDLLKPLITFDDMNKEDHPSFTSDCQPPAQDMDTSNEILSKTSLMPVDEEDNPSSDDTEPAKIQQKSATETLKIRSKSVCAQPRIELCLLAPKTRLRSNSVEQNCDDKAPEWRQLCTGSIAKALRNFAVPEESAA